MPTAGAWAARIQELDVSNAASSDYTSATYADVEKVEDGSISGSQDRAESSNNDSGGDKEYVNTWRDVTGSFTFTADENATGQEHLWTAFTAGEIRAFRVRPRGDVSGDRQIRFLAQITGIEIAMQRADVVKYRVTFGRTGGMSRNTQ
jgi:hypothetical protein